MPKYNSVENVDDILTEYSIDIQEKITETAKKLANQAVEDLKNVKQTYKIRTGKYNKGWKVKETIGKGFVKCTVHNGTNWQLTHLLEKGHVTRNGGKTKAFVHIKPVEEKYVNEYIKDVENIIKNGG